MEDLKAALNDQADLVSKLLEKLSAELRSGFRPAVDNFVGFFHAIDWKFDASVGTLVDMLTTVPPICAADNYHLEEKCQLPTLPVHGSIILLTYTAVAGVYLAERINNFMGKHWKSFASQNYFDPHGLFISVLWSGPLLSVAIVIVVNTLFTLCQLIIKWKKAELRHRARLARDKQE